MPGLYAWNQLGRKVKKGEKGIRILAPIIGIKRKKDEEAEKDITKQNTPRFGWVPQCLCLRCVADRRRRASRHARDFSGDVGENRDRLFAFIERQGIELVFTENIAPALGMSYGGRIAILPGQSKAEEFSTLVHELAHEMLHKAERRTATTKVVRETEAEAIAFVIGKAVGLETGTASADYIHLYHGNASLAGRELGSHPADLRRHPCRIAAAVRSRDDARCRTGEGGVMQTILHNLEKAGGWHHGLYLKIENPPYMALVIEAMDESGPWDFPPSPSAHYGEQNGDLMRDPEMCFELGLAGGSAPRSVLLAQRLCGRRAVVAATSCAATTSHLLELARAARTFAKTVGQQPALAGLRRSLHGQVAFAASPLPSERTRPARSAPLTFTHCNRSKGAIIMKTTIINATEYRNCLARFAHRIQDQPAPHLRGRCLEGTGREHPHPGRSLALAGAAPHRDTASRSSPERGVTAPRRWPKSRPFPSASSTSPTPKRWRRSWSKTSSAATFIRWKRRRASALFSTWTSRSTASSRSPRRRANRPPIVAARLKLTELAPRRGRSLLPRGDRRRPCALAGEAPARPAGTGLAACFKEDWSNGGAEAETHPAPRPQSPILD